MHATVILETADIYSFRRPRREPAWAVLARTLLLPASVVGTVQGNLESFERLLIPPIPKRAATCKHSRAPELDFNVSYSVHSPSSSGLANTVDQSAWCEGLCWGYGDMEGRLELSSEIPVPSAWLTNLSQVGSCQGKGLNTQIKCQDRGMECFYKSCLRPC